MKPKTNPETFDDRITRVADTTSKEDLELEALLSLVGWVENENMRMKIRSFLKERQAQTKQEIIEMINKLKQKIQEME